MHYKLLVYQRVPIDNMLSYLQANGFVVDVANEANILDKIGARDFDACLLDTWPPERYCLVRKAREASWNAAIIFLAKHNPDISHANDAINAFGAGADDCVLMPYDIKELVCRFNAVLKRSGKSSFGSPHMIGNYLFDPDKQTLEINGAITKLTDKEAKLLLILSEYRNTIMPRKVALKAVWVDDNVFNGRSMDVYITRLRKLLSKDKRLSITNLRSQGFALVIE